MAWQPPPSRPGRAGAATGAPPARPGTAARLPLTSPGGISPRAADAGHPAPSARRRRWTPSARRRRWILWVAVAVVVLVIGLVVGFGVGRASAPSSDPAPAPPEPASTSRESAAPAPSTSPSLSPSVPSAAPAAPDSTAAQALATLAGLPVVDGWSDAPYDRALFGQAWADVDRNGCDTRNDILGRDLLEPVFKPGTNDCKVLRGILIDPYDGRRVDFVSGYDTSVLVQIDHVVALAWAWRHGAEHWTDEQRTQFANDPANLLAASEEMNQQKVDSGPGEWLPPDRQLQCGYVETWVGVLAAYSLGIDATDKAAAEAVLGGC